MKELECKIREDLEGKDYEAMQLSARENSGSRELPPSDWRKTVQRALEEEGGKRNEETVRRIADNLGLSTGKVRNHITTLDFSEDSKWVLDVAGGKVPTVVRALRKNHSDRTKAEKEAIEEKFEKKSKEVPSVAESSDVLGPQKGLQPETLGFGSTVELAENIDRFKNLPFQEQVTVVFEAAQEGREEVDRALKDAEERLEGERKRKEREKLIGQKVSFRLNDEYLSLLQDYADFKNIPVRDRAAKNIVKRFLDEEVRDHPRKTSIK